MSQLEVALIGTGPPMLLEGMIRAHAGQKVIFIDQASGLGGSWKCPDILGHKGVEVGVHLIENRPHLNRVFEALIPPPDRNDGALDFGLWNGRRIPMNYARIALYGGIAGRNLFKGKLDRVWHSMKNAGEAMRYRNLSFIYPKRGMAHVLTMMQTRLMALGADFHFKHRVTEIDVTGEKVEVLTDQGRISVDHLVMSSRAHAPIIGFEPVWTRANRTSITSVALKVTGPAPLFDGYVEIINDPVLKRVRNLTGFAEPACSTETALIVVQLRRTIDETPPKDILEYLTTLGLLERETAILEHFVDEVQLDTLRDSDLDGIETAFPKNISVLRTVDLGDSRFDHKPMLSGIGLS